MHPLNNFYPNIKINYPEEHSGSYEDNNQITITPTDDAPNQVIDPLTVVSSRISMVNDSFCTWNFNSYDPQTNELEVFKMDVSECTLNLPEINLAFQLLGCTFSTNETIDEMGSEIEGFCNTNLHASIAPDSSED